MLGDKTAWRKGHASEAMRLRTEYAFRGLSEAPTGHSVTNHVPIMYRRDPFVLTRSPQRVICLQ